jgi:hypothetical protein
MPDILVDDTPCPVECAPADRFDTLMNRLESHLAGEGRIVTAVTVDGEPMLPEQRAALAAVVLAEMGAVRIATQRPLHLAATVVRRLAEALPNLRAQQERVVEVLEAGRRAEGMAAFRGCLEVWQVLQQSVLRVGALLGGDLTDTQDVSAALAAASRALADALHRVRQSLEADDLVALADVIQADLVPLTDEWTRALLALAARADAAQDRP